MKTLQNFGNGKFCYVTSAWKLFHKDLETAFHQVQEDIELIQIKLKSLNGEVVKFEYYKGVEIIQEIVKETLFKGEKIFAFPDNSNYEEFRKIELSDFSVKSDNKNQDEGIISKFELTFLNQKYEGIIIGYDFQLGYIVLLDIGISEINKYSAYIFQWSDSSIFKTLT